MILELQQFAFNDNEYVLHGDYDINKRFTNELDPIVETLKLTAKSQGNTLNIMYNNTNNQLPPSSIHSFIKRKPIPSILLSPFTDKYKSRTINSFFDTQLYENPHRRDVVIQEVKKVAELAKNAILRYVGEGEFNLDEYNVDEKYIETLVDCLIFDPFWNCSLIQSLSANHSIHITPHYTYIEISGYSSIRQVVTMLLIEAQGDTRTAVNVKDKQECLAKNKDQNLYVFFWQKDPKSPDFHCYRTSIYSTPARSPAFEIEGYDLANTTYSTFMESRWQSVELELYLISGTELDIKAGAIALIIIALFTVISFKLNDGWFEDPTEITPASV